MDILNTGVFTMEDMDDTVLMANNKAEQAAEVVETKPCCQKSIAESGTKCCKSKVQNLHNSGLSQVSIEPALKTTRHEKRFGITSFVYRARRPFHPGRLYQFIDWHFMMHCESLESLKDVVMQQKEAATKQARRAGQFGEILRSNGFVWLASSHNVMGGWSHPSQNSIPDTNPNPDPL